MQLSQISRSLWFDLLVLGMLGVGAYFINDFFQPRLQTSLQEHQEIEQNTAIYQVLSEYENPSLVSSRIGYLPTEWSSSEIQRIVGNTLREENITFDEISLQEGASDSQASDSKSQSSGDPFSSTYSTGTISVSFQSTPADMRSLITRFENPDELGWFMKITQLEYQDSAEANQITGSIKLEIYYK